MPIAEPELVRIDTTAPQDEKLRKAQEAADKRAWQEEEKKKRVVAALKREEETRRRAAAALAEVQAEKER